MSLPDHVLPYRLEVQVTQADIDEAAKRCGLPYQPHTWRDLGVNCAVTVALERIYPGRWLTAAAGAVVTISADGVEYQAYYRSTEPDQFHGFIDQFDDAVRGRRGTIPQAPAEPFFFERR